MILDIETEPNASTIALAPKGGPKIRMALHGICGFSILCATETEDQMWTDISMHSASGTDEYELLFDLDEALTREQEAGATLITYNGLAHDIPFIERRIAVNWLFSLPGTRELPYMPHRDLMREITKGYKTSWPSLRDLCAAYGIPTNHLLTSKTGKPPSLPVRKSQVDVIGTFLLLASDTSAKRAESQTISRAWLAIAAFLKKSYPNQPHLGQFAHNRILERAIAESGFGDSPCDTIT